MDSSITVDNLLFKKIKKLAAELGTTQSEVVERALEEFEKMILNSKHYPPDTEARKLMKAEVDNNPKLEWRRSIREKLSSPGIDIDELEIRSWGDLSED